MALHQPSQFFSAESARLSSLLDVFTAAATNCTDIETQNQCIELKNATSTLLEQAQHFSFLAPEESRGRWQEIQLFAGRSQAVKDAFVDLEARSTAVPVHAGCKKRARSGTYAAEGNGLLKRSRSYLTAEQMQADVVMTDLPIRSAAAP